MARINALDGSSRTILDSLLDQPKTIRGIVSSTGLSDSTVRQTLKVLTKLKEVRVDTERQPYMYEVSPESETATTRASVDKAKAQLMGEESSNKVMQAIKGYRREQMPELANVLDVISAAIRELEADGQLIDTL